MLHDKPTSAFVLSLLVLAAESACYTPPSCERQPLRRSLTFSRADAITHGDGSFTLRGQGLDGTYRSCADVCGLRPEVEEVRACTGPLTLSDEGAGAVRIECDVDAIVCEGDAIFTMGSGRAHHAMARRRAAPRAIHERLAAMAEEEAAAVTAFTWLASDLEEHGLDAALASRARIAAADEVRHFRSLARLARRAGTVARPQRPGRRRSRALVAIAVENAVEGCVREAAGAALLVAQAARATDPILARLLGGIARDELSHAALSWDVLAACLRALSDDDARAVVAELTAAARRLDERSFGAFDGPDARALGLPTRREARAMVGTVRRGLAAAGLDAWRARSA